MKRTKRMAIVTLVAVVAISVSLISTAFAAPANCPFASGNTAGTTATSSLLSQYLGNGSVPAPTKSACPSTGLLQQLLDKYCAGGSCTTGACPTANSTIGNCVKGINLSNLLSNCLNGNCAIPSCQR